LLEDGIHQATREDKGGISEQLQLRWAEDKGGISEQLQLRLIDDQIVLAPRQADAYQSIFAMILP
jgi:predicted 3-demethylubiquinone-9 3-methyltransferase (glyoxalase superfamily)